MDVAHRAQILSKNKLGNTKKYTPINKLEMALRLKTWMPVSYALCYHCLKYKPRGKAGWLHERGGEWGVQSEGVG